MPTSFQGFSIERIGGPRLPTRIAAYDELVRSGYIGAAMKDATDKDKEQYIKDKFPDDMIPTEFFIIGEENYKAFKSS